MRDVAALAQLDFAVLAWGAVPQRAAGAGQGGAQAGIALAGLEVASGDWALLDADGLVFVR